jgi:hypothetical protein
MQDLEHAPGNPPHALIFADADAELDDRAFRVPSGVGRKAKEPPARSKSRVGRASVYRVLAT